jgi:hypothetical protein
MHKRNAAMCVAASLLMFSGLAPAEGNIKTATETIQAFYTGYLNYRATPDTKHPVIAMSKSFAKAVTKNANICAAYATSICGWGADGDVYLDTQETDPELNYANSRIKISEVKPNWIQVKLNVYPSDKNENGFYDKTITYQMVKEEGRWQVDDVMYADGISTRKKMADENAFFIAHPDSDSPVAKRKHQ